MPISTFIAAVIMMLFYTELFHSLHAIKLIELFYFLALEHSYATSALRRKIVIFDTSAKK